MECRQDATEEYRVSFKKVTMDFEQTSLNLDIVNTSQTDLSSANTKGENVPQREPQAWDRQNNTRCTQGQKGPSLRRLWNAALSWNWSSVYGSVPGLIESEALGPMSEDPLRLDSGNVALG